MTDKELAAAMEGMSEIIEMQKAYHEKIDRALLKISVLLSNAINNHIKKNSK